VAIIEQMWKEVLGDDLLARPRLSRICYRGQFYRYPLEIGDTLVKLGFWEAARCAASYARAHLLPRRPEADFETYITNRFGARLFEIFFRSYTEKVWGMRCREIRADWASQRIRELSFLSLVRSSLPLANGSPRTRIRTLIHEFYYPRKGPGQMWERMAQKAGEYGATVMLNEPVQRVRLNGRRVESFETRSLSLEADQFISSMPLPTLVRALDPAPPREVVAAASQLRHRDFLIVALILRSGELFPDNWLYVHEPGVRVGRIQNFGNWSPEMVPDPSTSCVGMEYFCFAGDPLWSMSDAELLQMAKRELAQLGIAAEHLMIDGAVLRVPQAYPVYDEHYQQALVVIRDFLQQIPNLQTIGRNGMHRYNNQDHSMLMGLLAARNAQGGNFDLWDVNSDTEYQEQGQLLSTTERRALESTQPRTPGRLAREARAAD
jgi:protoporphyrinogen oxidase